MPEAIPDLWPEYVTQTSVISPLRILRHQAAQLGKRTNHVLEAEVFTQPANEGEYGPDRVCHFFELIVPQLNRYRYRLFQAVHAIDAVYPVRVYQADGPQGNADTQQEFIQKVTEVLSSPRTRGIIQSLLARLSEQEQTDNLSSDSKKDQEGNPGS
jgi:hypothetical protein